MSNEEKERIKEVYLQTEDGEGEPERYISYTLIACSAAVVALLILMVIIEFLVGWGAIFEKILNVLGVS
jgi:hypothetical protein